MATTSGKPRWKESTDIKAQIVGEDIYDCPDFEPNAVRALRQLQSGKYIDQDIVSVYHDSMYRMLAIRKYANMGNAMLVEDIPLASGRVGTIKAGRVVEISDDTDATQTSEQFFEDWSIATYQVRGPLILSLGRHSLWAANGLKPGVPELTPEQTEEFAAEQVKTYTLGDFQGTIHGLLFNIMHAKKVASGFIEPQKETLSQGLPNLADLPELEQLPSA
jgi:hypothetical protein